jgi:hypothetical protein
VTVRRALTALAVLAVATSTLGLGAPDAGAWTDGACTDVSGVTVVVDFQELGGGVHVRCAPGPVASGLDALSKAGIDHQTTVKFPGFLCKIAGLPSNDPCQTASPASAYWSYWIAVRGGQWCYSNWGAGNRTPPPGSVEGWSFSLGRDGSTAPSPRHAVPGPLPGVPTGGLSGGDCDPRTSAPTPVTPVAPDQGTGGAGSGVAGGAGTAGGSSPPAAAGATGGAGAAGGGWADAELPQSDPGLAPVPEVAPEDPSIAADQNAPAAPTIGDAPAASTTTPADASGAGSTAGSTSGEGDDRGRDGEQAVAVDLGDGGASGGGSPVGVLIASLLVVVLGGGAFYVRRRGTRP